MKIRFSIELKALGKAFLASLILVFLSAAVIYFSGLPETILPAVGKTILAAAVFIASGLAARDRGSKGLLRGMNMGLVFFILTVIATLALKPAGLDFRSSIYALCLCLLSGAIGGVVGIGMHK